MIDIITILKKNSFGARAKTRFFISGDGFTLIEILIASAIIAMFIPAVMGVFVVGNNFMAMGRNESIAVKIAQEGIESIKNMNLTAVKESELTDICGLVEDYGEIADFPDFKRTSFVNEEERFVPGEAEPIIIYKIKVVVYWGGSDEAEHELSVEHEAFHTFLQ